MNGLSAGRTTDSGLEISYVIAKKVSHYWKWILTSRSYNSIFILYIANNFDKMVPGIC